MSTLDYLGKQITIYVGILTLISGVIGGLLTIIVFISLRTFRENSGAFYLIIMSIVNIGQMITGLLSRIMTGGFNIDWTQTSLFYCKFRYFLFQFCLLMSMTLVCLSTIDQYFSTCTRLRWQRWCNIKFAYRLTIIFLFIWIIHEIPFLIYFDHIISSNTGQVSCISTNALFRDYITYGIILILGKILPLFLTFFFAFLSYYNVQQISHRTLPLVRRELDKQLTIMVLMLVLFSFFTTVPYTIVYLINIILQNNQNLILKVQLQFAISITTSLVYIYFASPFYIFVCVSERFRRQLFYVLFHIYLKKWRERRIIMIQVMPHT